MNSEFKSQALVLRHKGRTYSEINKILKTKIPKSTFSYWFREITVSKEQQKRIDKKIMSNMKKAQEKAVIANKKNREAYLTSVYNRVKHLKEALKNNDVAKIALAMLYLGEGSKTQRGSMAFGNSNPEIIALFLNLLRVCYKIDESRFRCTLQLRADQDIKKLEKFWQSITKIPAKQFYKARIDPRTIGKISLKKEYKGVCRIDYFSADIYNELCAIMKIICGD